MLIKLSLHRGLESVAWRRKCLLGFQWKMLFFTKSCLRRLFSGGYGCHLDICKKWKAALQCQPLRYLQLCTYLINYDTLVHLASKEKLFDILVILNEINPNFPNPRIEVLCFLLPCVPASQCHHGPAVVHLPSLRIIVSYTGFLALVCLETLGIEDSGRLGYISLIS